MSWSIVYCSDAIYAWIDGMPVSMRASYARITERMTAYGPNLGMPYTRPMGGGLFEIRAHGREGIARVLYCTLVDRQIVMLHGFIKKAEKTPAKELAIAMRRMKEIKRESP